jgi:hypothetical protein
MDLRRRITEELIEVKYNQLLIFTQSLLGQRSDIDVELIRRLVDKSAGRLGLDWKNKDIIDKAIAAFSLSDTTDINSPDFIRNPKVKNFNVDVRVAWGGYGNDYYGGTISGYSLDEVREFIENEGGYSELDFIDRDIRNYEVDEIEINDIYEEEGNQINESEEKEEELDYDRVKYYLEYYSNLTPSDFDICKKGNEIIITIPEERKS